MFSTEKLSSRHRSISERAEEILQRNRKSGQVNHIEEKKSEFELAYQELMDGLGTKVAKVEEGSGRSFDSAKSPTHGDSFELSAADFEVGVIAAKRLKERTADRGRRLSFDQELYQSKDRLRQTASPELKRRASISNLGEANRYSTALSSIQLSQDGGLNDPIKAGSVAPSETEFLNMLDFSMPGKDHNSLINSSFGILDYNNAPQFGTKSVAEDEREYEDDFESEIPGTNENADEKKILFDDVKAELTTVEQIMQRWYQAPPQSSTPIITHEDGNDLLKLEANRVGVDTGKSRSSESPQSKEDLSKEASGVFETEVSDFNNSKNNGLIAALGETGSLITSIPQPRHSELNALTIPTWDTKIEETVKPQTPIDQEGSRVMFPEEHENGERALGAPSPEPEELKNLPREELGGESVHKPEETQNDDKGSTSYFTLVEPLKFRGSSVPSGKQNVSQSLKIPSLAPLTKISLKERSIKKMKNDQTLANRNGSDHVAKKNAIETDIMKGIRIGLQQILSSQGHDTTESESEHIQDMMVILVQATNVLQQREKTLKNREQTLQIKEAVLVEKEKIAQENEDKLTEEIRVIQTSAESAKDQLEQEIRSLRKLNSLQLREINALKTALLDKNSSIRNSVTFGVELEPNKLDLHLEAISELGFEELKKEFAVQENLIMSYQKENARLTKLLKDQEHQNASKQAQLFDQQEALNRELNKLRNINANVCSDEADFRKKKSPQDLAHELEQDGKIRYLQDKLVDLESQMLSREKGFLTSINKYKQENTELLGIIREMKDSQPHELQIEFGKLIKEKEMLFQELQQMQHNKRRCDELEKKLLLYEQSLNFVKRELLECGVSKEVISQFLQSGLPIPSLLTHFSEASISPLKIHKDTRDRKRIRELEAIVDKMTRSVRDKAPDSVVSLICAANHNDSDLKRFNEDLKHQIRSSKEELQLTHENFEIQIRNLRLDHEKVVESFKKTINDLLRQIQTANNTNSSSTPLVQDEIKKVREFYCKKIEQMQLRFERKIRVLKRGDSEVESESKIAGLLQELTDERALNSKLNQEKVQLSAQLDQLRNEKSTFPNPPTTIKCDKMTETEKEDLSKSEMKSFSFEVGCQTNSSSTFDLESKILQLETKLGERETFFSKVVKQLQISTQFERQLLRDNFQKEILERDYKLREFENDIKLLLKQLSLFQETS